MFKNRSVPGMAGVALILIVFVSAMISIVRNAMGPANFDLAISTLIEMARATLPLI
jgi:hypothetical protein